MCVNRIFFFYKNFFLFYGNCVFLSKKFTAIIGKDSGSVHDTSLVEYRGYDGTCTGTGNLYIRPVIKSHGKCRSNQPIVYRLDGRRVFGSGIPKRQYVEKK